MSDSRPYLVVGAGPAGAAAAMALPAAGRRVLVLDTGLSLEPEREAARRRMAATVPAQWSPADLALTRFAATAPAAPATSSCSAPMSRSATTACWRCRRSVASARGRPTRGRPQQRMGIRSAALHRGDLDGWPITAGTSPTATARCRVRALCRRAGRAHPALSALRRPDGPLLLRSRAGEELLARLRRRSDALAARGTCSVRPRLAVRVGHPAPRTAACYCGALPGRLPVRPYLQRRPDRSRSWAVEGAIEYRPGLHVDRVLETDGRVIVRRRRGGGTG